MCVLVKKWVVWVKRTLIYQQQFAKHLLFHFFKLFSVQILRRKLFEFNFWMLLDGIKDKVWSRFKRALKMKWTEEIRWKDANQLKVNLTHYYLRHGSVCVYVCVCVCVSVYVWVWVCERERRSNTAVENWTEEVLSFYDRNKRFSVLNFSTWKELFACKCGTVLQQYAKQYQEM